MPILPFRSISMLRRALRASSKITFALFWKWVLISAKTTNEVFSSSTKAFFASACIVPEVPPKIISCACCSRNCHSLIWWSGSTNFARAASVIAARPRGFAIVTAEVSTIFAMAAASSSDSGFFHCTNGTTLARAFFARSVNAGFCASSPPAPPAAAASAPPCVCTNCASSASICTSSRTPSMCFTTADVVSCDCAARSISRRHSGYWSNLASSNFAGTSLLAIGSSYGLVLTSWSPS